MMTEIIDKSLMMILLQEECNLACAHCAREEEPMGPGYKLSFAQLQSCLSDCRSLESVRWIHFSGGEPTLWTEKNRNLVNLLLEISKAGFTPGFTTNGSYFTDYGRCRDFFAQYLDGSIMPLRLYLSIDSFHRNYSVKKGRSKCLDNVLKCKQAFPRAKADRLDIAVIVIVSKDPQSLLPDDMIRHYESLGAAFGFVPLLPRGRAKSLSHLCPDLGSTNPEDMGAYRRYYRKANRREGDDTQKQNRVGHILLIGDNYYFDDPWRKVAHLGRLPESIIHAYSIAAGA